MKLNHEELTRIPWRKRTSGTMIEPNSGHIKFNCGEIPKFNKGKKIKTVEIKVE